MSEQKSNTQKNRDRFLDTWYKKLFLSITIVGILILAFRIALNPIALHFTRQALADLEGYSGIVRDVSVSVIPPGVEIIDIELFQDPEEPNEFAFSAERIHLNILGNELLRRTLVAEVAINYPKVTFIKERVVPPEEVEPVRIPDIEAKLKDAPPMRINQVEIQRGEVVYIDATEERQPHFWIHDMDVNVNNIATREELAQDMPTTVEANAVVQKSGDMSFSMDANPWKEGLNFSGRTELRGLALTDLNEFLAAEVGLVPIRGTFDLFATFVVEENEITGEIMPELRHVEVAPDPEEPSILDWIKAKVVDATVSIFAGTPEKPEEEIVATIIPITGTIEEPEPHILPTLLGIIRNAFVEGISAEFEDLPPPTAPEEEGVIRQLLNAITPEDGQPKAQPEKDAGKRD
jgi:hypothetical protein